MLRHLLFWPITGPTFLTRFSLGKVSETVREELTNDQAIKEDLLALQMRLELGDIDEDQYVEEEALLMARLREVRYWREQYGMGLSGGPVRVAAPSPEPNLAEEVIAASAPDDAPEAEDKDTRRGGIASPDGASVEINFDFD